MSDAINPDHYKRLPAEANEITEGQFQAELKQILEDHDRAYKQTRYSNG